MEKNILIIGAHSELAVRTINELKNKDCKIYATSRNTNVIDEKVHEMYLDISSEMDFIRLKEKIYNVRFDRIVNFAGIAIASAVEELGENELKKQLDTNLFGLLRIIKHLCPLLKEDGILINISSMASYGIFPFISPYCISKASADILLNSYSLETGKRTVSIRPGATATKFWETSVELNKNVLENVSEKYKNQRDFLVDNAQKNSLHALNPIYVSKKIAQIIELKKPSAVYNIGVDAKIAKLCRFIPQNITNGIISLALKYRILKYNKKNLK